MKPRISVAILIALWLSREAEARRINKSRITHHVEPANLPCNPPDAESKTEACVDTIVERTTGTDTTIDIAATSQAEIDVVGSDIKPELPSETESTAADDIKVCATVRS